MKQNCLYAFVIFVWVIVGSLLYKYDIKSWKLFDQNVIKTDFVFYLIFSLIIVVLFVLIIDIIYFYFNKDKAILRRGDISYRIGYDITRLFSWFFSVDGLLLVLVGTVVAIIVTLICNFCSLKDGDRLSLTAFTLNISLAALIPSLISRIVAKNHLDKIIEEKLETELNNFKTSLSGIRRDKAHASRMSAVLLYQNAKEITTQAEDSTKNAIWSIGWASDAITQYLLIKDDYNHAKERIIECTIYIYNSYSLIDESSSVEIKYRDCISVLTMFALLKHFCWVYDIETSLDEQLKKGKEIKDIVAYFYNNRENKESKISGWFCRITGMNDEFNRNLESEAENIIQSFEGEQ